jgi:hypothetical protein
MPNILDSENHHLYITSDEEITGFENYIWVYNNGRVWLSGLFFVGYFEFLA